MSYTINKTDGSVLTTPNMPGGTLLDGTTDNSTGVTLIGRNFPGYGDAQNENFVRLLENFADSVPPTQSVSALSILTGTIWYDTRIKKIRVYDGTNWNPVSGVMVQPTEPSPLTFTIQTGDQWYDTTNQQLKSWNGTVWQTVGPAYSVLQGKSGSIVETIIDSGNGPHTVINTYTNNHLISITSYDPSFVPLVAINGITTIDPGINLVNTTRLNGIAEDSVSLAGQFGNVYARTDIAPTFAQGMFVNGNVSLTNSKIYYASSSLILQNTATNGNVDVYVNSTGGGNINVLSIDGATGLGTVYADPVKPKHISTKGYVDFVVANLANSTSGITTQLNQGLSKLRLDTGNYMTANVFTLNTSINTVQSEINAAIAVLTGNVNAGFNAATSNAGVTTSSLNSLANAVSYLAPKDSPALTGTPTAPTALPNDNSSQLATTAYVDSSALVLSTDYNTKINNEINARSAAIANALLVKAPIASPALTGIPTAPTPAAGDISTTIATTAFVAQAVAAGGMKYHVDTRPPTSGDTGYDFWFQI
jgi:hypothetical protein